LPITTSFIITPRPNRIDYENSDYHETSRGKGEKINMIFDPFVF